MVSASFHVPCADRARSGSDGAHVGVGVGPLGRAQQRKPQLVARGVVAELRLVDEAEAVLAVAQVGPAHGGNFKLRLLPTVVAVVGRSMFRKEFRRWQRAGGGERKGGLEEDVRLVPVDLVVDVHLIAFSREAKCLDELRILPVAGYTNAGLGGLEQLNESAWSIVVGGTSRVPGSIFHASYSFGVSLKNWS